MTCICVSKSTTIGSDNSLSPDRHQAIIWTNIGILLIGPLGTNFSEILIEIYTFSFKKMHLKMSSGKWWPFCLSFNMLIHDPYEKMNSVIMKKPSGYGPPDQSWLSWGRDNMAAISQTTLSNTLSWMKSFEFWIKLHWSMFLRVQLTIFQHWFT